MFISLCTGGYTGEYNKKTAFAQDRKFTCIKSDYAGLRLPLFLEKTAAQMAKSGIPLKNIFIQYHKPSFSFYKHPPLDKANDPVEALKAFGKKNPTVQMFVFNGHNHTTELYQPGANITVLVAGGGGAPQKLISPGLPSEAVKKIYKEKGAEELFWKALGTTTEKRTQRINYWTVEVNDTAGNVSMSEMVLTYTEKASAFVKGVTLVNGQVQ